MRQKEEKSNKKASTKKAQSQASQGKEPDNTTQSSKESEMMARAVAQFFGEGQDIPEMAGDDENVQVIDQKGNGEIVQDRPYDIQEH